MAAKKTSSKNIVKRYGSWEIDTDIPQQSIKLTRAAHPEIPFSARPLPLSPLDKVPHLPA